MKILLSGGGTLGSVAPLLAIKEIYQAGHPDCRFIWVGTKEGPERELVEKYGIPFFAIPAGKIRRYFSLYNLVDLFKIVSAFFYSLVFLFRQKPDLAITAGGFVSAPLHFAAASLGIPAWVHQQDARAGLANRLMAPFAAAVTTVLRDSQKYFSEEKTEWLGNPVRDLTVENPGISRNKLNIPPDAPVIFALGGGTGSSALNKMVIEALPLLPENWHIIHLTGKERPREQSREAAEKTPNYHAYEFFNEEMKDAYACADIVVSRAGFATITELASLQKPAVVIPMPDTHQEDNARFFAENKAAVALSEKKDTGARLARVLQDLMANSEARRYLGQRLKTLLPPAKPERIVEIIDRLGEKE